MAERSDQERIDRYLTSERLRLFGAELPPYADRQAAIAWVQAESARGLSPEWQERKAHFLGVFQSLAGQIKDAVDGFPEGMHLGLGLSLVHVALHNTADGGPILFPASTPKLGAIALAAEELAAFAHCLPGTATLALLAGEDIGTGRVTVRRMARNRVGTSSSTAVVAADASGAPALRPSGTQKDRQFLEVVAELERDTDWRPPSRGEKGVAAYWEAFRLRWNRAHPEESDQYGDWRACRYRWEAIQKRQREADPLQAIATFGVATE